MSNQKKPGRTRGQWAWRVTGWLAAVVVTVSVGAALTAYADYRSVWGSIKRVQITGLGHQPPKYTRALDILLIGSDSRSGRNRKFGAGIQGQRSDTIMLLHISPGRHRAVVVSLPRDTMVPVRRCLAAGPGVPGQAAQPGQRERINQAFANGGPGCLWETVEQVTGVHLDHFIELTFTGFEHVIDDIGGVHICLPVAVDDPDSGLNLAAGPHHVMGAQALAFWRERHIGLGSDLQRIQRDQYLMASIVRAVGRSDILGRPARLYSVVSDAARAMTTDEGLDQTTMLTIAASLRGLSSGSVQFVTVPEVPYPRDPQAEVWPAQPAARTLFTEIAHDRSVSAGGRHHRASPVHSGRARPAPVRSELAGPTAPGRSGRTAVDGLTRAYGGITGRARSCGDQGAFAGGDSPSEFTDP
jgi:LCP family protein required for cell wall assembly